MLANHIWSVGENSGNPDLNATYLQSFVSYTTKDSWTFTLNSESIYNWETEEWSVPVNAVVSKLVRFSLAADALWVKLSAETDTPFGIIAGEAELTTKTLMLTGVAGYSLYYRDEANLDILAGGRLWGVENELELKGGTRDGESFDDTVTWVDPVVGLKGHADLGSDFYVTGWGLVGGFGVSSKIMWDVMGGVGYKFNDWSSVVGGFRAFGVDYEDDGFTYDVVQSGPILGAVFNI